MSYDVWMEIDTGAGHSVSHGHMNYTFNCSPMFYRAMSESAGLQEWKIGITHLDDLPCACAYPLLKKAVRHMVEHADWHRQQNPANGWGDYDGALRFLAWICQQAKMHPKSVIRVSY